MISIVWLMSSGLLFTQPSVEQSVQQSVSANNHALVRCFELSNAESGFAALRFSVNSDGRADSLEVEELTPSDDELSRCLVRVLEGVSFAPEVIGAKVVYPVHYRGASNDVELPRSRPKRALQLSIIKRDQAFLVDDWEVVNKRGAPVSDLELARISGDVDLHTDLTTKQSDLFTYAIVEGVVAAASFVVAGYGATRLLDDPNRDSRNLDIGFTAGGGAVSLTAGGLCLYHLIRGLDLGADSPTWHHLEKEDARRLVAKANGS